jgi:hypothetical protein
MLTRVSWNFMEIGFDRAGFWKHVSFHTTSNASELGLGLVLAKIVLGLGLGLGLDLFCDL